MKKAVRTSLRFTRLNEDIYTRPTVYRDNEDLRAKVSRETLARRLHVPSRDKAEKQNWSRVRRRGNARHVYDPKLCHPLAPRDRSFSLSQIADPPEMDALQFQ